MSVVRSVVGYEPGSVNNGAVVRSEAGCVTCAHVPVPRINEYWVIQRSSLVSFGCEPLAFPGIVSHAPRDSGYLKVGGAELFIRDGYVSGVRGKFAPHYGFKH